MCSGQSDRGLPLAEISGVEGLSTTGTVRETRSLPTWTEDTGFTSASRRMRCFHKTWRSGQAEVTGTEKRVTAAAAATVGTEGDRQCKRECYCTYVF